MQLLNELFKTEAFQSEMQRMFFEAMLVGYAGTPKKTQIVELPGSKHIVFEKGHWLVTDTYLVTPVSDRSFGTTVIYHDRIPVWMMQYLGWYDEGATPCLKAALYAAYGTWEFVGGRGFKRFEHGNYRYTNRAKGTMRDFSGDEEIRDANDKLCGYHSYRGGVLF